MSTARTARTSQAGQGAPKIIMFDRALVFSTLCVLSLGLLMVSSASMVVSDKLFGQPFHFLTRQAVFLCLGLVISGFALRIPIKFWQRISPFLLFTSFILLALVLVPGVGSTVNGSTRWIRVGPVGLQVSELVKLFVVLYISGYAVRHQAALQNTLLGFIKPLVIWAMLAVLLLQEPDFGATVVMLGTMLGILFLAGVRLSHFLTLFALISAMLVPLVLGSHYRLARLTSFLDPWANQYGSGYQLTQSLIAFGRGGWFGVGLGDSIQKLFYLPEAHTDFVFAVLAEELGLAGELLVLVLFAVLIGRALSIGRMAIKLQQHFAGYAAYGIGLWLAFQVMVNIGVTAGLLPTKGLTLPLMSYGGSSLIVDCVAVAILLRIDYENRLQKHGIKR